MVEDVVGCKWTVQLLAEIDAGNRRPGRLRRGVAGISTKVMNERLAKLVRHGVLERRAIAESPPHVEYHLTAKGRQLTGLIDAIQRFCVRWDVPERVEARDPLAPTTARASRIALPASLPPSAAPRAPRRRGLPTPSGISPAFRRRRASTG